MNRSGRILFRALLLAAASVLLGTCTSGGVNLCPLQCFEDDCCDPVCKPAPKRGTSCTDSDPLCTYRSFDLWAAYECAAGQVQCYGTLQGCCPEKLPTGTCSDKTLRCLYDENMLCVCDGPTWHCFQADLDLSVVIEDAGGSSD